MKPTSLLPAIKINFLCQKLRQTEMVFGDIVEVGVYRGGSLWHLANESKTWGKRVHGYDTFEGLPPLGPPDNAKRHHAGQFADTNIDTVAGNLAEFDVDLFRGYYPETALHERVSFAHIDVDLHKPTLEALNALTPCMSFGGVIVVDDYEWSHTPGVAEAVRDWHLDNLWDFRCIDEGHYQIAFMRV